MTQCILVHGVALGAEREVRYLMLQKASGLHPPSWVILCQDVIETGLQRISVGCSLGN